MALRNDWKFIYKSSEVGEAAEKKHRHHEGRVNFWSNTQNKVMAEIKDAGLEITESQASTYSVANAGFGPRVTIRHDYQTRLDECFSKIREHQQAAEMYVGFAEVLALNPNQSIELDVADVMFFFGKIPTEKTNVI